MHPFRRLMSLAVLGLALPGGAALAATDVAKLPMKASVLAQPNVILGFDDSGSMDLEIMLDSNDGVFFWDANNGTGWDSAGKFHRRIGGSANSQWRRYTYLFNIGQGGSGTGQNLKTVTDWSDYTLPPTSELGHMRSSSWNPQYYDPNTTYQPWGPAQGYPATTFPNANPSAARGHPLYGPTVTVNLTATVPANTGANRYFVAARGMTVPQGAFHRVCTNGTSGCAAAWPATPLAADLNTAALGNTFHVAMPYWPATYWVPAVGAWACTVNLTQSVATRDCANAPDGSRLRRIEIRPTVTSYPSGRSYAAELQNFANWFQYHRKRRLSANAAMSEVLENVNGLNMGIIRMNARPATSTRIAVNSLDSTDPTKNAMSILKFVYEIDQNVATPTRETLLRIGQEFAASGGPVKFACQRNAAIIVTDGYANVASTTPPSYSQATYGGGAPYATTFSQTLADIALSYYTNPLRPSSEFALGKVPTSATDLNPNLHMNTYALTLGAKGNLYQGEGTPLPTSTGAWVNHTANFDPTAVDDLWHAAINGRGQMYLATSATETAAKLLAAFNAIRSETGAQGGVAVSTVNLSRGDGRAYFGTYNPDGWTGDVTAQPIEKSTGVVDGAFASRHWSASEQLLARDWTTRVIASANGTNGVGFTAADVGSVVNPGGVYGSNAAVIDYLRGSRAGEGTAFRIRKSLIGAIINSEPAVSRDDNVLYVQSGEGMLHAIDTAFGSAGNELWAFVPRAVLSSIGETTSRSYVFNTKLDASPTLGSIVGGKTLLVAGTGVAGRSFHALDVSSPRALSESELASRVRWEFPAAGDASTQAKVGDALGRPVLVKLANGKSAVLLTSGYNNNDGRGRMWMLELDGAGYISSTHEFDTGAGSISSDAGLAQVSAFVEDDGKTRYAYGGDLLGNLWRFDLEAKTAPTKLAVLKNAANQLQPVTAAPELTRIEGKRVVIVGTGRVLGASDFSRSGVETMYAIADGTTLANARSSLVRQTLGTGGGGQITISDNPVDWKDAATRGWYVDLPSPEQANTRPTIAYGSVAFTTNVNGTTDCSARSKLYVLNVKSGGPAPGADYVASEISNEANSSAVTSLLTSGYPPGGGGGGDPPPPCGVGSDGRPRIVYSGQDADGKPWSRCGPSGTVINPSKNAWREIRR